MRDRILIKNFAAGSKGQTILEYTVIIVIVLGVMIAMRDYVKRGIQGRWKSATDNLGDQYDPQAVNSNVVYSLLDNSQTIVTVENGSYTNPSSGIAEVGQWTYRTDTSNSVETKNGSTQVGD